MSTPIDRPALTFEDFFDPVFSDLLLMAMVRDRPFCARARGIVQPGYFNGEVYRALCTALFTYWDKTKRPPTADELAVVVAAMAPAAEQRSVWARKARDLYDTDEVSPESINTAFLGEQLAAFAQRAEAAMAVAAAYHELRTFDIDATARALRRIQEIPRAFDDLGIDLRADWRRFLLTEETDTFPTGLVGIDRPMRGGMRPGELVVFAAAKKTGKTMMLMNIASRLALMGNLVAYITLELYDIDGLQRFLAILTGKPTNQLREYVPSIEAVMTALDRTTEGRLIIKEFPGKSITVEGLDAYLGLIRAEEALAAAQARRPARPVVPVVDYADLLKGPEGLAEWQEPVEIYTALRALGREHGVPVVSASQINAPGFGKRDLGAQHLSASSRKAFVVDYMFYMEQTSDDYEADRLVMVPKENRNERRDLTSYWRTQYDCARLQEISKEAFERLRPEDPRA